jgi:hypothetical protein
MDFSSRIEQEIANLRVRRSLTGKMILQLRRVTRECINIANPKFINPAVGPWKDANGNDATEIAEVMALLQHSIEESKGNP